MSWKTLFAILIIIAAGLYAYFRIQASGNPDSRFNQTARYQFGRYPLMRTIFGLHKAGDARAEYLGGTGTIEIVYLEPVTDNVDAGVLDKFASLVGKYTGRPTRVVSGGSLGTGTVQLSDLNAVRISSTTQVPGGGSKLFVYFTDDFTPRQSGQQSATYLESGEAVALNPNVAAVGGNPHYLDNYLLTDLLHEFGRQIGLAQQASDSSCVMYAQADINSHSPEAFFGESTPQDFCPAEIQAINQLKLEY